MNKDHLFEKTAGDAEIERLESILSVYRFEPGRPPMLPENLPAAGVWSFGWLRYAFAVGAVAVAVITGLLAYGRIEKLLDTHAGRPEISDSQQPIAEVPAISTSRAEEPVRDSQPLHKVPATPQQIAYSRPQPSPRLIARPKPQVILTKQEKYAYDQLRVALFITGSKLKVVQDTIDRVDDKKTEDARDEK